MAENKTFNEEALVEMAHTMGFDLAHACAAAADAFARGVADGFAAYAQELAAENGGVELVHDEEDEEPELKTDIQDCRRCWCDTCGKLEECEKHRDGTQPDGLRPLPCIGCVNGLRFKPRKKSLAKSTRRPRASITDRKEEGGLRCLQAAFPPSRRREKSYSN